MKLFCETVLRNVNDGHYDRDSPCVDIDNGRVVAVSVALVQADEMRQDSQPFLFVGRIVQIVRIGRRRRAAVGSESCLVLPLVLPLILPVPFAVAATAARDVEGTVALGVRVQD